MSYFFGKLSSPPVFQYIIPIDSFDGFNKKSLFYHTVERNFFYLGMCSFHIRYWTNDKLQIFWIDKNTITIINSLDSINNNSLYKMQCFSICYSIRVTFFYKKFIQTDDYQSKGCFCPNFKQGFNLGNSRRNISYFCCSAQNRNKWFLRMKYSIMWPRKKSIRFQTYAYSFTKKNSISH